ncbi:hypothetical protein MFLAVUS_002549 [Mucor flavus]|uniref:Uncharacterized protein n=1 Tax=Mucor flavus TaxID=439312 RepID=A0ABP9YQL2_9FUNG
MECLDTEEFPFWAQLMHAASQGQLSCLKSLPKSSKLNDDSSCFRPRLARLGAYQTLCDQMEQFKNLKTLHLSYISDEYLSYYDGLIEKCHHLKEVNFDLTAKNIQPPNEPEPKIRPRPDVHTFECNRKMIDVESQLEYVMHKFPNLKTVRVYQESETNDIVNCSGPTLVKFIRYIISVSDFEMQIDIKEDDLLNIWTEFRKAENGSKELRVRYSSKNNWNIRVSTDRGITLVCPVVTNNDEPPHIRFFSGVGETIQLINIEGPAGSNNIDWLFDILQLCSLMEEITMRNTSYLLPSRNTLKYPSVKRLNIDDFEYTNSKIFHSCLSLNLPHLNQLFFEVFFVENGYTEPITIHMPRTSLDLLTWSAEIYIKLRTDTGVKFYVGIINMLVEIDSDRYNFFSRHIRFDISCKHLKKLKIKRNVAPESDANLITYSIVMDNATTHKTPEKSKP